MNQRRVLCVGKSMKRMQVWYRSALADCCKALLVVILAEGVADMTDRQTADN